jgi:NSS family neurotransmitter:Na+ symporter
LSTPRETFATRFGVLMSMIGVALGLGNVWRFPYMVGRYGGAAFVLFYVAISLFIGVPGLMAEWALGRETRRGTVGAFERGGLPLGKPIGWFLFAVVTGATAYYTNVIGWVLWYGIAELLRAFHISANAPAVLPPETGFKPSAVYLQMLCTAAVLLTCVAVLLRGLRRGIERISKIILPLLLMILIVLIVRALTLPGARAGLDWYILHFNPQDLTPSAMVAALGQAVFSLSLGGTFMVVYGSYLKSEEPLAGPAIWTTAGDTFSGVLAGLAIFPAVFALGLEPNAGPALLFSTIPEMFARIPTGWLFGLLFFAALFGAGYLSDIAALEVLIADSPTTWAGRAHGQPGRWRRSCSCLRSRR